MAGSAPAKVRCAIYTRKSSEEGLDQAFNSLDAQREACEAYIRSQAGEGWTGLKAAYDDGGISGGTMERPALQRLLADIERGLVDCVVVYKVDRLTRSLADFARIIDVFDRKGVSFCSVTQAFNTTSSMGRLTLNVLLSFAQFEREVIGERIRDKIAASKRRGMWMGGVPPLGYDIPTDRTSRALVVNPAEAEQVRDIFRGYLKHSSVTALRDALAAEGVRSKAWVSRKGRAMGGVALNAGSLFHLLQSRVYRGEICHRGERHPGAHEAIVDAELFEAVQAQLAENSRARRAGTQTAFAMPLKGRIFDAESHRMGPSFAYGKGGRKYAYYVSVPLKRSVKASPGTIGRVAARPLEALILDRLRGLSGRPEANWPDLLPVLARIDLKADAVVLRVHMGLLSPDKSPFAMDMLKDRLAPGDELSANVEDADWVQLRAPVRPRFRGGRTWLVRPDGRRPAAVSVPDKQLLRALSRAHKAVAEVSASPGMAPADWLHARSPSDSFLRDLSPLAFLAPDIQRACLEGNQPAGLSANEILRRGTPLAWADQRRVLGF